MLFRHSDQMVTQQIENMRGGQGTVAVKHLLNPDEMLGKGRLFAQNTVPPGASIGLHRHQGDSEASDRKHRDRPPESGRVDGAGAGGREGHRVQR